MNAQEAILKIKALFEDAPMTEPVVPSEPKVEMMEYSLLDGTKVMIDKLEVGGKVTMEDGSNAPLGEHQLADGTKVVVDEAGVILEMEAPKIVYVSCNTATQARDLALLAAKYTVEKIQPVDMFPHTHHIECVVLLKLIP